MDAPICGFNGEFCLQNYTTKDIVMGLFGGVTFAMSVVVILVYRNYKYEQELDSLLWKIESSELQVNIFILFLTIAIVFELIYYTNGHPRA